MEPSLELEMTAIDGIRDMRGYKEYAKAHARSDWERHREIMDVLKPISDAFRVAGTLKRVVIASALIIAFILSTAMNAATLRRYLPW